MEKYMKLAYEESIKAYKKNEVPVGAIIIKNNKIIAKAKNNRQKKHNILGHAEINCIQKAEKKLKDWRLNDCVMYVTLEPCNMCSEIIKESRIKEVVFATASPKFGCVESIQKIKNGSHNHIPFVKSGICCEKSAEILKDFFENKRG